MSRPTRTANSMSRSFLWESSLLEFSPTVYYTLVSVGCDWYISFLPRRFPRKKQHSNTLIMQADLRWFPKIFLLFFVLFKGKTLDSRRDSCFSFFAGGYNYFFSSKYFFISLMNPHRVMPTLLLPSCRSKVLFNAWVFFTDYPSQFQNLFGDINQFSACPWI